MFIAHPMASWEGVGGGGYVPIAKSDGPQGIQTAFPIESLL